MRDSNGRLSSWKEIAAHFGKNVRTVQRWEEQLGLPVHRVPGRKRDLVFAYEQELDEWMLSSRQTLNQPAEKLQEDKEAEKPALLAASEGGGGELPTEVPVVEGKGVPRSTLAAALAGIALGLLALVLLLGGELPWNWGNAQPANWQVEANRLRVADANGRELWQYTFARPLDVAIYQRPIETGTPPLVQVVDLENDGRLEVLFIHRSEVHESPSFYCFNSDGSIRFARRPGRLIRFGEREFDEGYVTQFQFVTAEADGRKTIWLAGVHFWEPSVLEKLNPQGEVLGEFWHAGHIHTIQEGMLQGRRVILAGYVRNENRGASLAVIDYENPSGSAPAQQETYKCRNCPIGGPLAFFTFPRMELSRVANSMPRVNLIRQQEDGETLVSVRQTDYFPTPDQPALSMVIYTLDANLDVVSGQVPISYEQVHTAMEASGQIKHHYSPGEAKELFPIRKWKDGKVESISAPFFTSEPLASHQPRTKATTSSH